MQALRVGDAVRAVERVMRGLGMEHHAAVGPDGVARGDQQVLDVVVFDPPPADFDFDLGERLASPAPEQPIQTLWTLVSAIFSAFSSASRTA